MKNIVDITRRFIERRKHDRWFFAPISSKAKQQSSKLFKALSKMNDHTKHFFMMVGQKIVALVKPIGSFFVGFREKSIKGPKNLFVAVGNKSQSTMNKAGLFLITIGKKIQNVMKKVALFFALACKKLVNTVVRIKNVVQHFFITAWQKLVKGIKFLEWFFATMVPIALVSLALGFWISKKVFVSDDPKNLNSSEINLLIDNKMSSTAEQIAKQVTEKFYAEQEAKRLAQDLQTETIVNRLRDSFEENQVSSKRMDRSKSPGKIQKSTKTINHEIDEADIDELVREEVLRQLNGGK